MSRFLIINLALVSLTSLVLASGCNNGRSRDLGGPRGVDTGTITADGGMDPDGGGEDAMVGEDTMPPPMMCDAPFIECSGGCVDITNDDDNCGSCGIVCTGGYCDGGFCVDEEPGCPSPRTMCGESCVDTQANSGHCGGCFEACSGGDACRAGRCVSTCTPSCSGATCGSDGCGGSCGSCGSTTVCMAGRCEAVPTSGEACGAAIPIFSSTTFTFSGHTPDHTPFSCGTSSARPDVAYVYTAVLGGSVTVTARGASGADTMLAVYSGSSCAPASEVGCNDDTPVGGGRLDSELTFTATRFSTYYIVVAPYEATTPTDTITLTVTEG
jgi:hypothetical protein